MYTHMYICVYVDDICVYVRVCIYLWNFEVPFKGSEWNT